MNKWEKRYVAAWLYSYFLDAKLGKPNRHYILIRDIIPYELDKLPARSSQELKEIARKLHERLSC